MAVSGEHRSVSPTCRKTDTRRAYAATLAYLLQLLAYDIGIPSRKIGSYETCE